MATVTFDNVNKMFGDFQAVKDLNLEIGDGEFMVLVGPSGCGKTTSLRMIAGLEEISSGNLKIGDRVVNDVPPKDRDIAMVFQSYALYPHMSVRDNLAFGLKLRKVPKAEIERRVNEAAETIQLQKLLDRKPKELSGGQRQRVALGRAIVREPAVFLMDEPLSNLDAKLRVQTRAEIARLHQRLKTTVVYVTHDQVEAMTMGTRIAVMNEGLLQQVGAPQVLYDTPINRFVAGFIGSPSMNFAEVHMEGSGESARLVGPGDWSIPLPNQYRDAATPRAGKTLVAGFRPEHLDIGEASQGVGSFQARADVVEYLGNEELLHVNAADQDIVAIVDSSHRVRPGDIVNLVLPLDKVHLFDGESGLTLAPGRRGRRLSVDPPADDDALIEDLTERVVDSRIRPSRPLPDVPGRHDRAGRWLARDARDRRPPGRGRDRRHRRGGPRAARAAVPRRRRRGAARDPGRHAGRRCDDGSIEDPERRGTARARGGDRDAGRDVATHRDRSTPRPGSPRELMHLYLATDLRPADGERLAPDEDEHLLLERLPWRDAVAAAERGELRDAKTIVGCSGSPACAEAVAADVSGPAARRVGPSRASASR